MKWKEKMLSNTAVTLMAVCVIIVIAGGLIGYINLDSRIRALHQNTPATEAALVIDFLKEQIQVLIWLFSIIITGACAVFAFLEINTRKSIENKYKMHYLKLIKSKDEDAKKKQIVFIYEDIDDTLIGFRNEFRSSDYNTVLLQASALNIIEKIRNAAIVVYRVYRNDDPIYQKVAEWCDSNKIHCILFCPHGLVLPKDFMSRKLSFMSISNQIAKLRESLYTLLYLAP